MAAFQRSLVARGSKGMRLVISDAPGRVKGGDRNGAERAAW